MYRFTITVLPGKNFILAIFMMSLSLWSLGQKELRVLTEFGVEKSVYSVNSNIDNLKSPSEFFAPWGLGVEFKAGAISIGVKYENRNFKMSGPTYRDDLGGFNNFGFSGPNRIHSGNLLIGYDVLKLKEKIECSPVLNFGYGYMDGYEIFDRAPTFLDTANRSRFTIINAEDSSVVQTGSLHHLYTSNTMMWGRVGVRISYHMKRNFLLHIQASYTYGFTPFYRSVFIIEDEGLNAPITGTTSNSATSFGVRFGISYRIPIGNDRNESE